MELADNKNGNTFQVKDYGQMPFSDSNTGKVEVLEPEKEKEEVFDGFKFEPVKDTSSKADQVAEVNNIFDFAAEAFETKSAEQSRNMAEPKKASEIIPDGMIEVSADLYVEILEAFTQSVCQYFGDQEKNYLFDRHYKEKYKGISAKYFRQQNILVSPTQLFFFATIALIGGVGTRAFKDRRKRIKAEAFSRKNTGTGTSTANVSKNQPGMQSEFQGEGFSRDIMTGESRKRFSLDSDGFYEFDRFGKYAKKGERERPASADLNDFITARYNQTGKWPNHLVIKTYLNN